MPQNPLPCPNCGGRVRVRNSGPLYTEERTGLLVRECLVRCKDCKRSGKMLVTLDIAMYEDEALHIEPTPLSAAS